MEVGQAYFRKGFEYKVVAKVLHEEIEGCFVYMIAEREFGSSQINYFTTTTEFDEFNYIPTDWIGSIN